MLGILLIGFIGAFILVIPMAVIIIREDDKKLKHIENMAIDFKSIDPNSKDRIKRDCIAMKAGIFDKRKRDTATDFIQTM